jgi:hypothetical protein
MRSYRGKTGRVFRLVAWIVIGVPPRIVFGDVAVTISNQNVARGATVEIPIQTSGLAPSDSLIAYQATVVYNPAVLQATGASKTGTMTQNWDNPYIAVQPGAFNPPTDTIRVVGITTNQPGKRLVADAGMLVKLQFLVTGATGSKTLVRFGEVRLAAVAAALTASPITDGEMTVVDNASTKTVSLDLAPNWNLVSLAISPDPSGLPDVFGGVPVGFVFSYASGVGPKTWDSVRPAFLNDLKALDGLHGYWMKLNSQTNRTLTSTGVPVAVTTPIVLNRGWGLVGYLPESNDSLTHAFESLGSAFRFVSAYEANAGGTKTWDRVRPKPLNDLQVLKPTLGYWLKMDSAKSLVYPASGYKAAKAMALGRLLSSDALQSSPQWCDFWAYQPDLFVPGDTVRVFDQNGVLCGDTVVAAERGFLLHVAGDDPTTLEEDEGAVEGESIRFEMGGRAMRVLGTSISFDTTLIPDAPAVWENMGSKRVRLGPDTISPVPRPSPSVPGSCRLLQNHPNPFNGATVIRWEVPASDAATLTLFDVHGRLVRRWISRGASAREGRIVWDGKNENGVEMPSGMYFYRLETKRTALVKKCLLIH